nr:MAG TPA: holin [Caudoviricetes sp.]
MHEFEPFLFMFLLVIIDYLVGTIAHSVREGFSSTKMREGLLHKFAYFVVLMVCVIIQDLLKYYDLPFVYGEACLGLAFVWICVTEVGSILENVVLLNPDLKDVSFMRIFDKCEKEDEGDDAKGN